MQQVAKGLDYSARSIPGIYIKNAGYNFVIRYVGFPGNRKCITPEEYKDLIANGIRVYAVYEYTTEDSLGGFSGGKSAALAAKSDMARIGFPPDAICFFCADRHLANWEIPISQDYINGAASVFGWARTGAYGFQEFIWAIQRDNNCKYLWQCGAESYVKEGVHFYQWNNGRDYVNGVECDVNKQFLPVGANAPGGGGTGGDFLMSLTDQEQRELLEGIRDIRNDLSTSWREIGVSSGNIIKYLYEAVVDMRQNFSIPYTVNGEGKSAGEVIARLEGNLEKIENLVRDLGSGVPGVDMDALVKAFADEQDRRNRDGDPKTGSTS